MNRKQIERESQKWLEQGILNQWQIAQILDMYPKKTKSFVVLPILASILIGLGILSFVASNWSGMPNGGKLAFLVVLLSFFYVSGERMSQKQSPKLGVSLIGMGVLTFGASLILIGQMYHLISYDARVFLFWSLVSIISTWIWKSRYLFLLSQMILLAGQLYSLEEFHEFSYLLLGVFVLGLIPFWLNQKSRLLSWFLIPHLLLNVVMIMEEMNVAPHWFLWFVFFLFVIGDYMRMHPLIKPFVWYSVIVGFLFTFFASTFGIHELVEEFGNPSLLWLLAMGVLFALNFWHKYQNRQYFTFGEWGLFLPWYALGLDQDWIYLFAMFFFSLSVLWSGFEQDNKRKVNGGMALFLFSTFLTYLNLSWDFLPKSILFMIGGLLLLVLSYFLHKKRKDRFEKGGDR